MWRRKDSEDVLDAAGDLALVGERSLGFVIGFGVVVPLVILWFAVEAWRTQEALFFADSAGFLRRRMRAIDLDGDAARAMAVAWGAVAVFLNGRNCWGAMGFWRTQNVMMGLAALGFIAGVLMTMVYGFAGV